MTDIAFVRKVLEFVENEHSDFKHEQGVFIMTPEIAKTIYGVRQDGDPIFYPEEYAGATGFYQAYGQNCKTAACIAGTACLLDPDTAFAPNGNPIVNGEPVNWSDRAAELLGMDRAKANTIFWQMDEATAIEGLRQHLHNLEAAQA